MNLKPHNPKDFCTRIANVAYDPNATCPTWDKFVLQIFDGNQELVDYFHRALGYSLTGLTSEQCWFFMYGTGANGKSTALKVIHHILGSYAESANITTFLQRSNDSIRSDLARLQGARFISLQETGNYSKLDLGLLKQFSSGDPITARFLYGKEFTYRPVGKLWFHGNSKPTIRASDEGTWRRVRLIPFTVTFKINQQDKNLDSKLIAESTGILNKFLLGLKNFQDLGSLDEPTAVTNAIADYRSSQDPLQDWLDECCYTHNPNSESLQPDLFRSFSAFRESQNASFRISDQSFSNLLDQKGFPRSRRISKGWLRSGITLKNHQEPYNPTSPPNIDKPTEEEARLFEHDD